MTAAAGAGAALPGLAGSGQGRLRLPVQGRGGKRPGRLVARGQAVPGQVRRRGSGDGPRGQAIVAPGRPGTGVDPEPVFISRFPADLVKQALGNVGKPYPWGGDYANAKVVICRLAAANAEDGLKQVNPKTTVVVNDLAESYRRPDFANPA